MEKKLKVELLKHAKKATSEGGNAVYTNQKFSQPDLYFALKMLKQEGLIEVVFAMSDLEKLPKAIYLTGITSQGLSELTELEKTFLNRLWEYALDNDVKWTWQAFQIGTSLAIGYFLGVTF